MKIAKGMEDREPASERFDIVTPLWAQRATLTIRFSHPRHENGHTKCLIDKQSLAREVCAALIALSNATAGDERRRGQRSNGM